MHDGQNLLETHVPVLHYSEIGHVFSGSNPEFAFPYSNLTLLKDLPGTDLTRGGGGGWTFRALSCFLFRCQFKLY